MRIQHNIMAMNAYRNYGNNTSALSKNLEKLSSGYRINRAGDDAAGLAISEKMRAQIQGLNAAQKNVKDAISFVKTAEGAMQEIQDMLSRMKYLATQSANGTYENDVDRKALQDEVDSLLEEINRIADSANFNDIHMLNGGAAGNTASTEDDADKTSTIAGDMPVGAALTAGKKTPNVSMEVKGDLLAAGDFKSNTGVSIGIGSYTDKSITVSKDGKEYTVTLTSEKVDEAAPGYDHKTVEIDTNTSPSQILEKVTQALQAQMNADRDKAKVGNTPFTAFEELKLTLDESTGNITGATISTVEYTAGSGGTDNNVEEKAPAVKKDTKVDIDMSGLKENFKEGEKIQIGGKWFVFKKAASGGDDQSDGEGGGLNPGLALALSGQGTETSPFEIDPGEKPEDALAALASAITEKKGDLGFSATFANGKLTLTAEKDFDTAEAFKNATELKFADPDTPAAKAFKEAWDKAVSELTGGPSYSIKMQIGDSSKDYDTMTITIRSMKTDSLGITGLSIATPDAAHSAIDTIKTAINTVSSVRGQLGAYQNRLEHTANNLSVMTENIQDAESTIRDTDVAEEMMAYTKNNILIQSAQAMLAQANAVPQGVLQLLG